MELSEDVVVKVKLKNSPKIIATAVATIETVHFGLLNIKGIVIWRSDYPHSEFQENINITFPKVIKFGNWIDILFLEDQDKWRLFESRIYDAFCLERSKVGGKREVNEEVNPDDIPL